MENEERNYCVYMHTTPSNKRYVGLTSQDPIVRWQNGNGYRFNEYFYRAINKYGWDNIEHEILFTCLTKTEACEKEIEMIKYYKSDNRDFGYNIDHGGCAPGRMSEETKRKISIAHIGVNASPVSRYTIDGKFVCDYISAIDAGNDVGVSYAAISACCRNIIKTVSGCIWRYSDEELTDEHIAWCNYDGRENRKNAIKQYTTSGEFIREYESAECAQREFGYCASSIRRCCRYERRTCNGYIWLYAEDIITTELVEWCNRYSKEKSSAVVQFSKDGKFMCVFGSIKIAAEKANINKSGISHCCAGDYNSSGGYVWKYAKDIDDDLLQSYIKKQGGDIVYG